MGRLWLAIGLKCCVADIERYCTTTGEGLPILVLL